MEGLLIYVRPSTMASTLLISRFLLSHTSFLVFSCHCLSFSVFSANRSSTGSTLCRLLVVIHPRSFSPQLTINKGVDELSLQINGTTLRTTHECMQGVHTLLSALNLSPLILTKPPQNVLRVCVKFQSFIP